jgi:hypothetical protein
MIFTRDYREEEGGKDEERLVNRYKNHSQVRQVSFVVLHKRETILIILQCIFLNNQKRGFCSYNKEMIV